MTREDLGNVLEANLPSRTLKYDRFEQEDITDQWIVMLISTDSNGIIEIYCDKP